MSENTNTEVDGNNSASNANQIFDLIQSIQSKLNNENIENAENKENTTNIDNSINNENENTNSKNTVDFSSILNNVNIGNILNSFSNKNVQDGNSSNSGLNLNGFDPSTLLNLSNIFSSVTQDNPKRNLLLSLKPFLRKTRQDKLNEYITILTIVDAIGIFNSKGSGK